MDRVITTHQTCFTKRKSNICKALAVVHLIPSASTAVRPSTPATYCGISWSFNYVFAWARVKGMATYF